MLSVDTFLTRSRIRAELRLPASATDLDEVLTAHREAAAAWVESYAGLPVLDRDEIVYRATPSGNDPLVVRRPYVRRVRAVAYWTPGSDRNGEPDGTLGAAALGRTPLIPDGAGLYVFPPVGGWPAMDSAAGVYVRLTSGMPEDDPHSGLVRQAGIVAVRQFFNGAREIRRTDALAVLLDPVKDILDGRELNIAGWDKSVPDVSGVMLTYGGEPLTLGGERVTY